MSSSGMMKFCISLQTNKNNIGVVPFFQIYKYFNIICYDVRLILLLLTMSKNVKATP